MKENKLFCFIALLLLASCQNYNSNSGDANTYGPVVLNEADPNFAQAYSIIVNRCVNCHSSNIHSVWSSYTSNNDWLNTGMVNRGDPDNSYFIQRIINYGASSSNMPQGGSALPAAEYNHLRKWIEEIP